MFQGDGRNERDGKSAMAGIAFMAFELGMVRSGG
jgi:hypothetical protein